MNEKQYLILAYRFLTVLRGDDQVIDDHKLDYFVVAATTNYLSLQRLGSANWIGFRGSLSIVIESVNFDGPGGNIAITFHPTGLKSLTKTQLEHAQ